MFAGHHSDDGRIQPLLAHLTETAARAGQFATVFNGQEWATLAAMAHDIGKYAAPAQRRILKNGPRVDHSTAGAQQLMRHCEKKPMLGKLLAYCAAGHHAGLLDGGTPSDNGGCPTLQGRLHKQDIPDFSAFADEVKLPPIPRNLPLNRIDGQGFSLAFFVRMLFSCLVDADFLDTEAFMSDNGVRRGGYDDIPTLLQRLNAYIRPFQQPTNPLNRKRTEILNQCIAAGTQPKGTYTLTVPTGGGKTIASLAFALHHAAHWSMDRVICVIPYTSIIEQTAGEFRKILGATNVVEHHANFDFDDTDEAMTPQRLSTENWDAPVIATTNVQFFESLFANRTSKCRKLHNIANSVLVFDEAQMIPHPYLRPCVRAIAELVHNYGCTALLCSATQPNLQPFFPANWPMREICRDPGELYRFFRRTHVEHLGSMDQDGLAARLNAHDRVLCILNTRKLASALFGRLQGEEGNYHLSTLMTPAHRKAVLAEIRQRLRAGLRCRVVATSLIEAGVDVDFPALYRQEAGIDNIVQAAGRCNREGKQTWESSPVYVFHLEGDGEKLPAYVRRPLEVGRMVAANHADIAAPEAIHAYFQALYDLKGEGLDQKCILQRLEAHAQAFSFPFAQIAHDFTLIDTRTLPLVIPTQAAQPLLQALTFGGRSRSLFRKLEQHTVEIYSDHWELLSQHKLIQPLQDTGVFVLADAAAYSPQTGLTLSVAQGQGVFLG